MAVTQFSGGRPQQGPPTTPSVQIIGTPTKPPGAPSKRKFARHPGTSPSQIIKTPKSPHSAPFGKGYTYRPRVHFKSRPRNSSLTDAELVDFLTILPFTAPQIQCILWLSWTTTATPPQIAEMHNRAFFDSRHKMTHWKVMDIENDVATNWHDRGGSFRCIAPMSLLVPPGDDCPFSCLCDLGVQNCYDFKRDQESDENLEKLSMARTLWDATPREMVRCPHGRRRPVPGDQNLQPVGPERAAATVAVWGWLWVGVKVFTVFSLLAAIPVALSDGEISRKTAEVLSYVWMAVALWLQRNVRGPDFTASLYWAVWETFKVENAKVAPGIRGAMVVLFIVGWLIWMARPGLRPHAMRAIVVCLCHVWVLLAVIVALEIDHYFGSIPVCTALGFGFWLSKEVNWIQALRVRVQSFVQLFNMLRRP